jgi:hypothetical protein
VLNNLQKNRKICLSSDLGEESFVKIVMKILSDAFEPLRPIRAVILLEDLNQHRATREL